MTAVIKKFAKAPAEKLDYAIASSQWIVPSNTVDGPGNQSVSLDDGVTVDYGEASPSPVFSQGGTLFTDLKVIIYLTGGTLGKEYVVENQIVTTAGRKYARRIKLVIQDKTA
jgi:hypothetical protein